MGESGADGGRLMLMPAFGGSPEVLVQFPPRGGGPEQLAWTPDSENIVYRNGQEIWSVPRRGGEPRKLEWPIEEALMGALRNISFSPDGRRIAFDAVSGEQELWVMENFLSGH
jgi:Tol biopolymer transport system component